MLLQKTFHPSCNDCLALRSSNGKYECRLGVLIRFATKDGKATNPEPLAACHKPKNSDQYIASKKILNSESNG